MTDGAELRLSKSSIDDFLDCHHKWYLSRVRRIKGAPTRQMAVGRAVHAGIEAHWKGEDGLERAQSDAAAELASVVDLDESGRQEALQEVTGLVRTYITKIAPTFTPKLVEAEFLIRVEGTLVSGKIDAADEDVHDTKTTSTPSKVDPIYHGVEMTIYDWGLFALTGQHAKRLLLDVIGRNGRAATKEVKRDDQGMAETVGLVSRAIMAADFGPTGARTGQCVRCPFLERECKYGRA